MSARVVLPAPVKGIVRRTTFQLQPDMTCADAFNVQPADALLGRDRLGSRPGLVNIGADSLGGPIWMLQTCRFFQDEQNKSRLVASALGNIYMENDNGQMVLAVANAGISSYNQVMAVDALQKLYIINTGRSASQDWPTAANENYDRDACDALLAAVAAGAPIDEAAYNTFQRSCYFGDSAHRAASPTVTARLALDGAPLVYDPKTKTIAALTASAGSVPLNCTIGVLYRGRLWLAGQKDNPQEWFASRAFDFTDWNYGVDQGDELRATSSQNSVAATISGPITALAPHGDSCIVFATKTSLWILQGDPTTGQVRNLSYEAGIVDKFAWCHTPDGWLVFLSQDGIYTIANQCSEGRPDQMSRIPLPEELLNVNTDVYSVSLVFDVRRGGINVFLTPNFPDADSSQHWWIDWNHKSFFRVEFANSIHDPMVVCHRRDLSDTNSATMLGCRDGVIRRFSYNSETDDGLEFDSFFVYQFLCGEGDEELKISGIVAKGASGSNIVTCEICPGFSAEDAYASTALETLTWDFSERLLTPNTRMFLRANDFMVRVSAGTPGLKWALEQVVLNIDKVACAGGCR